MRSQISPVLSGRGLSHSFLVHLPTYNKRSVYVHHVMSSPKRLTKLSKPKAYNQYLTVYKAGYLGIS